LHFESLKSILYCEEKKSVDPYVVEGPECHDLSYKGQLAKRLFLYFPYFIFERPLIYSMHMTFDQYYPKPNMIRKQIGE
jgi:hypothetical protein